MQCRRHETQRDLVIDARWGLGAHRRNEIASSGNADINKLLAAKRLDERYGASRSLPRHSIEANVVRSHAENHRAIALRRADRHLDRHARRREPR